MTDPDGAENPFPRLGALVQPDGSTIFRVWAPAHDSVTVELATDRQEMNRRDDGVFEARLPVGHGTDYRFLLPDEKALPDPWSFRQPDGIRGVSRVVDLAGLPAGQVAGSGWPGVALDELVIYELHVGTSSAQGTFEGVIPRLPELRELGVSAIEVMPIASFAGRRGWGYDGVYAFAPHEPYGGPAGFARLVAAAHEAGLGVILDVVYNHLGAGADQVKAFAPYMTDRHDTFWGEAIDYARRPVREWAIQNAEMWVRDYGVDGLRLDAVHAIFDDSPRHVMAELADRVRRINPRALLISEMEIGDLRPIEQWGHDAQWEDALHHACHVLLSGEHEGYYRNYGRLADVARELERPQGRRFVVCAQNHDQVGNRAIGDRLRGRDLRLAAFCAILSRGTPMLFQGEEYDEPHPFQYFTDHIDPEIARMTREGRRREFADFSGFSAEEIPDPQDPATFERSKLDPEAGDPAHREYYRGLLELRRRLPDELEVTCVDETRRLLKFRRGVVELVANFSDQEQEGVPARTGEIRR
ncbi:MAG TPA: alpha-amylase family glycosyl hydrolase [Solirubrobacteraceae bacterium]|nr:alpha-amylase family glycosyl hydrolase [Solirubrobacteraceae bacterium]